MARQAVAHTHTQTVDADAPPASPGRVVVANCANLAASRLSQKQLRKKIQSRKHTQNREAAKNRQRQEEKAQNKFLGVFQVLLLLLLWGSFAISPTISGQIS